MSDFPPFRLSDSYATRFPMKLWRFANTCKTNAINWGQTGKTLKIHRTNFVREYLAVPNGIFKTRRFSSFIRQLNLYGFRKLVVCIRVGMTSADVHEILEYHHPYFRRGHPELLACIQRRMGNTSAMTIAPCAFLEGINNCLDNKSVLDNIEDINPNQTNNSVSVDLSSESHTRQLISPVRLAVQRLSSGQGTELAVVTNASGHGDGALANFIPAPLKPYQLHHTSQSAISLLSNPVPSLVNIEQSASQLTNDPLVLVPVQLHTDSKGQQQLVVTSQPNYGMSAIQPLIGSNSGLVSQFVSQPEMRPLNDVLHMPSIPHTNQHQPVLHQAHGQPGVSMLGPAVASPVTLTHLCTNVQPPKPSTLTIIQSCAGVANAQGLVYPATIPIAKINSSSTVVDVAVTESLDNISLVTSTRLPRTFHLSPNNLNMQANCSYTERANSVLQYLSTSNFILPSSAQQTVKTCSMHEWSTDSEIGCTGGSSVTINPVSLSEPPPPDAALVYVYLNKDGTVTLEDTGNTPRASGDANTV